MSELVEAEDEIGVVVVDIDGEKEVGEDEECE